LQVGVAEVEDHFAAESFDAVVSCLAFSEFSTDERSYALRVALRLLVPGGRIVIADESEPNAWGRRTWHRLVRWPRSVLTYLLTQASTQPVRGLASALEAAGFSKVDETRLWSDTFVIVEGLKPG
jgi:ubiquinone/menaquinone biosynthesis C-methylase UbiE